MLFHFQFSEKVEKETNYMERIRYNHLLNSVNDQQ